MKKAVYITLLLILAATAAQAQEYIIRQFPALDTLPKTHGPNRRHYNAIIAGGGFFFGPTDSAGSDVRWKKSYWINYGWRHKYRHSSFFNTGTDFFFSVRNYNIAQTNEKVFGGQVVHKKERYFQFALNLSLFTRFNLVKRGDHLGQYIDLFATGIYSPLNRHYTYDAPDASTGARRVKNVYRRLPWSEKFFAEVGIRYGLAFVQLQAFYRPLNMFKKKGDFPYPELPVFGAGIIIDFEQPQKD